MKDFRMVQEHFMKLRCAVCQANFHPDGVSKLRQEKDYWVVRVVCLTCKQPAGVAIIGIESAAEGAPGGSANPVIEEPKRQRTTFRDDTFSSIRERNGFKKMLPINVNDVIGAHDFIKALDGNWAQHIPKKFRDK